MCLLKGTNRISISQKTALFTVTALTTSNLTYHWQADLCSGDVLCFLWVMNWGFISQKTAFFIVTTAKTSNITVPEVHALEILCRSIDAVDLAIIGSCERHSWLVVLPTSQLFICLHWTANEIESNRWKRISRLLEVRMAFSTSQQTC
jgi:hypothetical protein